VPTQADTLWDALHALSKKSLTPQTRTVLALQNYDEEWATAPTEERRSEVLRNARQLADDVLAAYEGSGRTPRQSSKVSNPQTNKVSADPRWPLWRDLMRVRLATDGVPPDADWEPLRFYFTEDRSVEPITSRRVEISFDWRMPRAAVEHELVRAWAKMKSHGWIRPSKPLSSRLAELVRFNCLVSAPNTPWRDRLAGWNARCAEEWKYDDVRAFEREFRRAEQQLTGRKWGLAWFYEQAVRSGRLPDDHNGSAREREMYWELYGPMVGDDWIARAYDDDVDDMRPGASVLRWRTDKCGAGSSEEEDWGTET